MGISSSEFRINNKILFEAGVATSDFADFFKKLRVNMIIIVLRKRLFGPI